VRLGALGLGPLASCGPVKPPRVSLGSGEATRLSPVEPRIDAVPGRALLFPVRVEGPVRSGHVLRMDSSGEVEATLVWIGVRDDPGALSTWLPAFERWVAVPAERGAVPASRGAWHLLAHPPAEAHDQTVELAGRALPIQWLADPESLSPGGPGEAFEPWQRPENTPDPDPTLLAPQWRSPLRLWHARLVTTRLGRPGATPGIWEAEDERGALDDLADLLEARWRVGLARLWHADPEACRAVLTRLCRTVELEPGIHAPAWPEELDDLDALLEGLLNPSLTGPRLIGHAQTWLASLARSAVWVADDAAGLVGEGPEALVRIRAACLDDDPLLVWATGEGDLRVGDPYPLEPGGTAELLLPAARGRAVTGGRAFTVRAGGGEHAVATPGRVPVRPPGLRCGPLLRDWTLASWASGDAAAGARPEHDGAALLFRESGRSGWSAFVECAGPAGPGGDEVTLWFGQRGAPSATVRIRRDGRVVTRAGPRRPDDDPEGAEAVAVGEEGDRWSATVPVPEEAFEPGGVVRVGVTRVDGEGVRTAWPRRMLPWEREPARIAADVRAWSGLGG
jgi:hypothetical protein